jgi:hypothetical protein
VEEPKNSTRREWADRSKVFKLYRCEPGMCNGSNTCNRGRVGVACGRCPENHALEAGVCVECNVTRDPAELIKWQAAFGVVVFLLASVVWFLFAWAPLFGGTAQSFLMTWFAWCVVNVVIRVPHDVLLKTGVVRHAWMKPQILVLCVCPGPLDSSAGQQMSSRKRSCSLNRARQQKNSSQTLKTSSSSNSISRRVHICVYICVYICVLVPLPCFPKVLVRLSAKCPTCLVRASMNRKLFDLLRQTGPSATHVSDLCICSPPDSHYLSLTFRFSSPTWSVPNPYTPRMQHSSVCRCRARACSLMLCLCMPLCMPLHSC